jgi:hypothetical protein
VSAVKWAGADSEGFAWELEVEHDQMKLGEPHVITVNVWDNDGGQGPAFRDALAILTPPQAREVAAHLCRSADRAEGGSKDA